MKAAPDDPRKPKQASIQDQIARGIASGFQTVLRSQSAADAEARREMADAVAAVRMAMVTMREIASGAGSAMSPPGATAASVRMRSMDSRFDPSYLSPFTERAAPRNARERHASEQQAQYQEAVGRAREMATRTPRAAGQEPFGITSGEYHAASMEELAGRSRQDVRDWVWKTVGRRAEPWALGKHADGAFTDLRTGQVSVVRPGFEIDSKGRYHHPNGKFSTAADAVAPLSEIDPGYTRRSALASSAMKGLSAWKSGEPVGRALMSSLPAGALKAAGVAGAAWYGINKGIDLVQSQYAANAEYKQVYGYSSQGDAFKDRASHWLNGQRGRFTVLGQGAYNEMWDGAMDMGLRGGRREDYIQSGTSLMRDANATSEQARKVMEIAIEAGQGLSSLTETLKGVSDAAKEAGINGNRAREIFIKNYEKSSEALLTSQGAKTAALAFTRTQIGIGRQYEGIDYSGTINTRFQSILGAQTGATPGQVMAASERDPGAYLNDVTKFITSRADTAMQDRNGVPISQAISEFVASIPDFDIEIDGDRLRVHLLDRGYNPEIARLLLTDAGVSGVTTETALLALANYFISGGPAGAYAEEQAKRTATLSPKNTTIESLGKLGLVTQSVIRSGENGYAMRLGGGDLQETLTRSLLGMGKNPDVARTEVFVETGADGMGRIRTKRTVGDGRVVYPGIQELINNKSELGVSDATPVIVETPSGRMVIRLDDAIMNYPDQVGNGSIRFMEEGVADQYRNMTLAEALGFSKEITEMEVTTNKPGTWSIKDDKGKKGDAIAQAVVRSMYGGMGRDFATGEESGRMTFNGDVQTLDQYRSEQEKKKKEDGDSEGGGEAKVSISLAPGVADLLRFSVNGSPYSTNPTSWDGTSESLSIPSGGG